MIATTNGRFTSQGGPGVIERGHGIEHQEDGERSERDALRQRQPRTGGIEPGLMRGDLHDPGRDQRGRQRQERCNCREADYLLR